MISLGCSLLCAKRQPNAHLTWKPVREAIGAVFALLGRHREKGRTQVEMLVLPVHRVDIGLVMAAEVDPLTGYHKPNVTAYREELKKQLLTS